MTPKAAEGSSPSVLPSAVDGLAYHAPNLPSPAGGEVEKQTAPTEVDVEELKRLLAKASEGDWFADGGVLWREGVEDTRHLVCCGNATPSGECCGNPDVAGEYGPTQEQIGSASPEDCALIAALKTAAPALLSRIEGLERWQAAAVSGRKASDEFIVELERDRDSTRLALQGAVEALEDVVNPIRKLRRLADAEGKQLGGMAYQVANDLGFVQSIAKDALTKAQSVLDGAGGADTRDDLLAEAERVLANSIDLIRHLKPERARFILEALHAKITATRGEG